MRRENVDFEWVGQTSWSTWLARNARNLGAFKTSTLAKMVWMLDPLTGADPQRTLAEEEDEHQAQEVAPQYGAVPEVQVIPCTKASAITQCCHRLITAPPACAGVQWKPGAEVSGPTVVSRSTAACCTVLRRRRRRRSGSPPPGTPERLRPAALPAGPGSLPAEWRELPGPSGVCAKRAVGAAPSTPPPHVVPLSIRLRTIQPPIPRLHSGQLLLLLLLLPLLP